MDDLAQTVSIHAAGTGLLDDVPVEKVAEFERRIMDHLRTGSADLCATHGQRREDGRRHREGAGRGRRRACTDAAVRGRGDAREPAHPEGPDQDRKEHRPARQDPGDGIRLQDPPRAHPGGDRAALRGAHHRAHRQRHAVPCPGGETASLPAGLQGAGPHRPGHRPGQGTLRAAHRQPRAEARRICGREHAAHHGGQEDGDARRAARREAADRIVHDGRPSAPVLPRLRAGAGHQRADPRRARPHRWTSCTGGSCPTSPRSRPFQRVLPLEPAAQAAGAGPEELEPGSAALLAALLPAFPGGAPVRRGGAGLFRGARRADGGHAECQGQRHWTSRTSSRFCTTRLGRRGSPARSSTSPTRGKRNERDSQLQH